MSNTAQTAADGGASHGGFPPFDSSTFPSQLVWLALSFGVLYGTLARLILPRISRMLDARRTRLVNDLDSAARLMDGAQTASAAYDQALHSARQRALALVHDMNATLKNDLDAERTKIETTLNEKIADADKKIGAARAAALTHVESIAQDVAEAVVSRLLGENGGVANDVRSALKRSA